MSTDLVLRHVKGGGTIADPMGWVVSGVISPLEHGFFARPQGLICSRSGLLVVKRSYRGFFAAGIDAGLGYPPTIPDDDNITLFSMEMRELAATFARRDISSITCVNRWMKNEIRLTLTSGNVERFFIFARAATPRYRDLLKTTFPDLYNERGFDTVMARFRT